MSSMDSDQEIISTHNLNKKFGGIVVAKNVNFSVEAGELRCLIGPNGAGKSTLFSLLCGIEKACLLYTSPSQRDAKLCRMPSSARK